MSSPNLTFNPNPQDLKQIRDALDEFEIKVQDKIVRQALTAFSREEIAAIRSRNDLNPNHLKGKRKIYRSGIAWNSVAYLAAPRGAGDGLGGRAKRKAYDAAGVGWRSHFTELGFHSWAKGMSHAGKALGQSVRGRAWKRGLRHRGRGVYHRGTRASELVHRAFAPRLLQHLWRAISETKVRRGR
jgi:hypothetical protein